MQGAVGFGMTLVGLPMFLAGPSTAHIFISHREFGKALGYTSLGLGIVSAPLTLAGYAEEIGAVVGVGLGLYAMALATGAAQLVVNRRAMDHGTPTAARPSRIVLAPVFSSDHRGVALSGRF